MKTFGENLLHEVDGIALRIHTGAQTSVSLNPPALYWWLSRAWSSQIQMTQCVAKAPRRARFPPGAPNLFESFVWLLSTPLKQES